MKQCSPSTSAVYGRKLLTSSEIARVVKEMDVHQVKCCTVDKPACSQEALSAPLALGKKVLRKFCLLFDLHRLDVAGVNGFTFDTFEIECRKVPDLYIFD